MNMSVNTNTDSQDIYSYMNNVLYNPFLLSTLFIVLLFYVLLSFSLGSGFNTTGGENNTSSSTFSFMTNQNSPIETPTLPSSIVTIVVFVFFLVVLLVNAYSYYFYGVSIIGTLYLNNNKNMVDIDVIKPDMKPENSPPSQFSSPRPDYMRSDNDDNNPVPEIMTAPQVFNIPKNVFTYDDARAVCKSYGAELATYNQIEDAYNKGASWCSQGWSDGQNVFYPTQEKDFNSLQKIKGHEHDCGRIGINGGYISNPNVRFGANCYGHKPKMTPEEHDTMMKKPLYPVTKEDIEFQARVDYWKKRIKDIIVSPFNSTTWSRF